MNLEECYEVMDSDYVKKPRTLYRKMTDYFSILLLLPLLIVLSSGLTIFMSTMVKNMEDFVLLAPLMKFLVRLIPFILTWAMRFCFHIQSRYLMRCQRWCRFERCPENPFHGHPYSIPW